MSHVEVPNFENLRGVVSDRILDAAHTASKALTKAGVRHALIGSLAVGAYGYVRATKDVDFLVGEEGFVQHGAGIVTFAPGVPIEVAGIPVDVLGDATIDLEEEVIDGEIPIIDLPALVYLKLLAFRRRDQEDLRELYRSGVIELDEIRNYLAGALNLLLRLSQLIAEAQAEE